MLLPQPTAPLLRDSFTRPYRRASHADQCSNVQRSRVNCWDQRRKLRRWGIWTECSDVDEPCANDYTGNADTLFDTIDRYAVQIEFPASTNIAAQGKSTTVSDERSCFFDSATDVGHGATTNGEIDTNPLTNDNSKAAYRLWLRIEHSSVHGKASKI